MQAGGRQPALVTKLLPHLPIQLRCSARACAFTARAPCVNRRIEVNRSANRGLTCSKSGGGQQKQQERQQPPNRISLYFKSMPRERFALQVHDVAIRQQHVDGVYSLGADESAVPHVDFHQLAAAASDVNGFRTHVTCRTSHVTRHTSHVTRHACDHAVQGN